MNKRLKTLLIISMTFSLLILASTMAQARPKYQPDVRPLEGCHVCHENQGGGGPMNAYGADWVSAGNSAKAIVNDDSDGDGHSNGEEIRAGTLPGDPNSNPGAMSPVWIYLGIAIVVIGGTIALFVAAAKVRAKQEQEESEQESD